MGDTVGAVLATALAEQLDEVHAALRGRLSAFKVPTRWWVTTDPDQIPMTATGKVDKRALRARLQEEPA